MTSPWAREPSARMVWMLVLSLRNFTEPSAISTLDPPEWKLLIEYAPGASMVFFPLVEQFGTLELGGWRVLPRVIPVRPQAQFLPSSVVWAERVVDLQLFSQVSRLG